MSQTGGYLLNINDFTRLANEENTMVCSRTLSSKGRPDIDIKIYIRKTVYDKIINLINLKDAKLMIVSTERTEIPILRINLGWKRNLDITLEILSVMDLYQLKGEATCAKCIKHWEDIKDLVIDLSNTYLSERPNVSTNEINEFMFIHINGNRYDNRPENLDFIRYNKNILENDFLYSYLYNFNRYNDIKNYKRGFEYYIADKYSVKLSPSYNSQVSVVPQEQNQIRKSSKIYALIYCKNNDLTYIINTGIPYIPPKRVEYINKKYSCKCQEVLKRYSDIIVKDIIKGRDFLEFKCYALKTNKHYTELDIETYNTLDIVDNTYNITTNKLPIKVKLLENLII